MLKLLKKDDDILYYTNNEILFHVYDFNFKNKHELEEKLLSAKVLNLQWKETLNYEDAVEYSKKNPIAMFSLYIRDGVGELESESMSLWQYLLFVKKERNPWVVYKSVLIGNYEGEDNLNIFLSPWDEESDITHKRSDIIKATLNELKDELLKLTNKKDISLDETIFQFY